MKGSTFSDILIHIVNIVLLFLLIAGSCAIFGAFTTLTNLF